jgi:hypothetical protein
MKEGDALAEYLAAHILLCLVSEKFGGDYFGWRHNGESLPEFLTLELVRANFCKHPEEAGRVEIDEKIPF